jgi:hypothetical protein
MPMSAVVSSIKYKSGYKYQLVSNFSVNTDIIWYNISTDYITLNNRGVLNILKGYAWDGPSGFTYDSKNSLRASLVHDALYQCLRFGLLPKGIRKYADKELNKILKEDCMWVVRRWYWLKGVRWFAGSAARKGNIKPILTAP